MRSILLRRLLLVVGLLLLAYAAWTLGGGFWNDDSAEGRAVGTQASPRVRLEPGLVRAGLSEQDVQSLSEIAQLNDFGRNGTLTTWAESQQLAALAVRRCRAAAGKTSWSSFVTADVERGITRKAALVVNRYIEERICPLNEAA